MEVRHERFISEHMHPDDGAEDLLFSHDLLEMLGVEGEEKILQSALAMRWVSEHADEAPVSLMEDLESQGLIPAGWAAQLGSTGKSYDDFDSLHHELKATNTNWRTQLRDNRGRWIDQDMAMPAPPSPLDTSAEDEFEEKWVMTAGDGASEISEALEAGWEVVEKHPFLPAAKVRRSAVGAPAQAPSTRTEEDIDEEFQSYYDSNPLSEDAREALNEYLDDAWNLNSLLREDSADAKSTAMAASIDKTMKPLDADTQLFRGFSVSFEELFGEPPEVGGVISDKAFVSTTSSRKVAEAFRQEGTFLEIEAPAGTRAVQPYGAAGNDTGEYELILARGTRFRITEVVSPFHLRVRVETS